MIPNAPSPSAHLASSKSLPQRSLTRSTWRALLCLLALGVASSGGCALSPGHDIPSITTDSGDGLTGSDSPTTGSPIAGTGGASSAPAGGAPGVGGTGTGGEPCLKGWGGQGGEAPTWTVLGCSGDSE